MRIKICAAATPILIGLIFLVPSSSTAASLNILPGAGGEGIQQALDQVGAGGEVVLSIGTYLVRQPIILRQDGQTLRGAGAETVLYLADNASCPVIILGAPLDKVRRPTVGLHLSSLLVDGNRPHQPKEIWRFLPDGSGINNNGVDVWDVADSMIERVICRRCRSGGLVITEQTRRLTVRNYTAYDNQFDGLACYLTEDSHFGQLKLHDNLAAGISLDVGFNNNVIDSAVLTGNGLGIFMRQSRDNVFAGVTILHSRHDGVFMAQTGAATHDGWRLFPGTECTGNNFKNLRVIECGGKAFQVNNDSCTNNFINGGLFLDNAQGGLSQPKTNPVTEHGVAIHPLLPKSP